MRYNSDGQKVKILPLNSVKCLKKTSMRGHSLVEGQDFYLLFIILQKIILSILLIEERDKSKRERQTKARTRHVKIGLEMH